MSESITLRRKELKSEIFDSERHWRILFLGRSVNGSTDIVSCLARALKNLGHKVLNLDTSKHGLIRGGTRHLGGNGPNFVDVAKLDVVLKRFRPQLVIFCAGGLAIDPDDAQRIRQMGVVTVGMTLSDPDVLPTVANYAGSFDFHTTNALAAIDLYQQKNISNTLYFPFGIDRGYITQELPAASDLNADVICLGHATSRPERDGVMSRLARRFDVKTYGRGWSLPGSHTVEGTRQIQAARQGKCHVNFAATRAGYINIKCGVFETIGSGALLCTSNFPEMEHFFSYDDEIVGWDSVDELEERLDTILGDEDLHRRMVEKAFMRLTNEHLYEHRWLSLFDQIDAALKNGDCKIDTRRASEIEIILSDYTGRSKQVVLSGFYGAKNAGDELILRSIAQSIEKSMPEHEVVVAAENPLAVEIQHGYQAFKRSNILQADHATKNASAVVVGGGGLWHDYTFEKAGGIRGIFTGSPISIAGFGVLPLIGRVRSVPFFGVGLGVGPLANPEARLAVRFLALHSDHIVVRDEKSLSILRDIGVPDELLSQSPDVVYGVEIPHHMVHSLLRDRAGNKRIVGVSVRHWRREEGAGFLSHLAAELDRIAKLEEVVFVGLPMQEGPTHDRSALKFLFESMTTNADRWIIDEIVSADNLFSFVGQFDVLVGMRLHACLVAHRLGIPAVGLAYDDKVTQHFLEIGREAYVFELSRIDSGVGPAVIDCLGEKGAIDDKTRSAILRLEKNAVAELARLGSRIAATAQNVSSFEIPSELAIHEIAKETFSEGKYKLTAPSSTRDWMPLAVRPSLRQIGPSTFFPAQNDLSHEGVTWNGLGEQNSLQSLRTAVRPVLRPTNAPNVPSSPEAERPDLGSFTSRVDSLIPSQRSNLFGEEGLANRTGVRNGKENAGHEPSGYGISGLYLTDELAESFVTSFEADAHLAQSEIGKGWYRVRLDESVFGGIREGRFDASFCNSKLSVSNASLRFSLDAPKRNESISWSSKVELIKSESFEIQIVVDKQYCRPQNSGWVSYTLHVNESLYLIEDFAMRSGKNILNILVGGLDEVSIKISVTANKDCKKWSWEKVSLITISDFMIRRSASNGAITVSASSPFSKIHKRADSTALVSAASKFFKSTFNR